MAALVINCAIRRVIFAKHVIPRWEFSILAEYQDKARCSRWSANSRSSNTNALVLYQCGLLKLFFPSIPTPKSQPASLWLSSLLQLSPALQSLLIYSIILAPSEKQKKRFSSEGATWNLLQTLEIILDSIPFHQPCRDQ